MLMKDLIKQNGSSWRTKCQKNSLFIIHVLLVLILGRVYMGHESWVAIYTFGDIQSGCQCQYGVSEKKVYLQWVTTWIYYYCGPQSQKNHVTLFHTLLHPWADADILTVTIRSHTFQLKFMNTKVIRFLASLSGEPKNYVPKMAYRNFLRGWFWLV